MLPCCRRSGRSSTPSRPLACAICVDALVIVILFALPELLLTIERREPLASLTTLAVTPRLWPLMALTSWLSVSPLEMLIGAAVPLPTCSEKLPAESPVLLVATGKVEYHEEVVARLLTSISFVPVVAPAAAEAVTTFVFEESAEIDANDPVRLFSELKSFSTEETWLLTVFRSLSSPWIVVACACHCVSGVSAAVTAAFTASVTSMPSELEPVATSSSELKLMPLDEDALLDPSNDARADDDSPTELIAQSPYLA